MGEAEVVMTTTLMLLRRAMSGSRTTASMVTAMARMGGRGEGGIR